MSVFSLNLSKEKPEFRREVAKIRKGQATNLTGNFWTNTAWNDPCVLALPHASYRMYLSRNSNDLYTDGRAEPVSLFYADSEDGLTAWTKDAATVLSPASKMAIYCATSTDGLVFTEDTCTLLLNTAQTWTAREIRAGNALMVGKEYYLWFAGDNYSLVNGTWTGAMTIGLARWAKEPT